MRIDKKLNLTFPVESELGDIYVHTQPISAEVFKSYFRTISKAYTQLFGEGLNYAMISGPRIARLIIEEVATRDGVWDSDGTDDQPMGVKFGLVGEIDRLTNVFVSTASGWTMMPLEDALKVSKVTTEDADLIRGTICFFTLASSMQKQKELSLIFGRLAQLWDGSLTSSNCMEYQNSLPTLTETDSTTESKPASSQTH